MSIGFLTLDIIIILIIFIGSFIYSFNAGKKEVVKLIFPIYITLLIFSNLKFSALKDNTTMILTFVVIYLILMFLLRKNFTAPSNHSGSRKFFDSLFISIAAVFMLLVIYYKILPISEFYNLKLPFSGFLIQKIPSYISLLVPIFAIFITNRRDD